MNPHNQLHIVRKNTWTNVYKKIFNASSNNLNEYLWVEIRDFMLRPSHRSISELTETNLKTYDFRNNKSNGL